MKAIDRYVVGLIMPTLAVTLFIAAVILTMDRLMRLLDLAVGNGVSTLVVFQMVFNMLPNYLSLALPVGLFLGVLLAFRRMSMQSELDAIHSCGIGIGRLIRPALALAAICMALNFILSGYIQPYTRYIYNKIYFNITSGLIEQGIGEGVFRTLPNGYTLRVEESSNGGRELTGVFAHKQEDNGHITTMTAKRGELITGALNGSISLRLFDGNWSQWDPSTKATSTVHFDQNIWGLNLDELLRFRGRGGETSELTTFELVRGYLSNFAAGRQGVTVDEPAPQDPPERSVAPAAISSELHFRLVFALSIFLLPLLAAPFGIMTQRSSKSFGMVAGLSLLVSYHKVLEFTEKYASHTGAPAGIILWTIFVLFAASVTWLFFQTQKLAGTPPVQRFEAHWTAFWSAVSSIFRPKRAATARA